MDLSTRIIHGSFGGAVPRQAIILRDPRRSEARSSGGYGDELGAHGMRAGFE